MKKQVTIKLPKNADRATYIRCLLVSKGITGAEIGRCIGVSRNCIFQTINGNTEKRHVRQAIANAVCLPFKELWGDDE